MVLSSQLLPEGGPKKLLVSTVVVHGDYVPTTEPTALSCNAIDRQYSTVSPGRDAESVPESDT